METIEGLHTCHFCGDYVKDGYGTDGERHWLSDCRPDLVEHEIGPLCTWSYRKGEIADNRSCYAYQDRAGVWTNQHIHFYKDGAM